MQLHEAIQWNRGWTGQIARSKVDVDLGREVSVMIEELGDRIGRTTEDKFGFISSQIGDRIEGIRSLPGLERFTPTVTVYDNEDC